MSFIHSLKTRSVILIFALLNTILLVTFFIVGGYPTPLMLLHFLSILLLGYYVAYPFITAKNITVYKKDILILLILFITALSIRLYLVGSITPGMDGDEVAVAISSEQVQKIGFTPFIFNNYGHGTLIPYLVGMSMHVFGKSIEAIRFTSVLFGALGICVFYILIRMFFKRNVALFASLLFMFSYAHFALSRVMFEPTTAIFFEILTFIFLLLTMRKNTTALFIALGLSLAVGNYTYLNFRLFTIMVFLLLTYIQLVKHISLKEKLIPIGITAIVFLCALTPLFHYSVIHPDQLWARTNALSVFHQRLSLEDITQNIVGNIKQLIFVFLPPGDPNNRINPGVTSMFDFGITTLFLIGSVFLFRKQKMLFFVLLSLFLPFIVSDIFSYESGPANTFFGFAHPNTLRISGIIPLVYCIAAFGITAIKPSLDAVNKTFYAVFFSFLLILLCAYNMWVYFAQPYNAYTYHVNGVEQLDIVNAINTAPYTAIYISPSITKDIRFIYFQQRFPKIQSQELQNTKQALQIIQNNQLSIIDVPTNVTVAKDLVNDADAKTQGITKTYHTNPLGQVDALIYIKQ